MNAVKAKEILQMLLDGVNPVTGEIFPDDHVCNEAIVIRALHHAIAALEKEGFRDQNPEAGTSDKPKNPSAANAGKPWTSEDDGNLIEMYESGASIGEIAAHYKRTRGAIHSRLVKLGLIEDKDHTFENRAPSDLPIDNEELKNRLIRGETIPDLARRYGRTEKAIRTRLFYMGLGGEAPNVIPERKKDEPSDS